MFNEKSVYILIYPDVYNITSVKIVQIFQMKLINEIDIVLFMEESVTFPLE